VLYVALPGVAGVVLDGSFVLQGVKQHPHTPLPPISFNRTADTFIQKTKKLFQDSRSSRNLAKINDDLAEVHTIMTRNIAEVLGQGEQLDSMTKLSSTLAAESKNYSSRAKDLHRQVGFRFGLVGRVKGGVGRWGGGC